MPAHGVRSAATLAVIALLPLFGCAAEEAVAPTEEASFSQRAPAATFNNEARFATFNASLHRFNAGDLAAELSAPGSAQPDVIAEIIQRLSQLVTDLPVIQEVDLNPVIAYGERVAVVDARIAL